MNGTRFNINKAVSSFVARLSRRLGKVAVSGRNLGATALDVVEPTESMAHFKQILAIGRLGRDGRLSGALEAAQRVARLHASQTRPPETEPCNR